MENDPDNIVEIFSGTLWESEMIKSLLQYSGIKSFTKNSVLNSYVYGPIYATGVKVMILFSGYEKAKEIVDNYYRNLKNQ